MQRSIRSLSLSHSLSLSISLSLSLSLSLALSLSFSLSLSLYLSPIINISDEAPHISCGKFPWKTERDGTGVNKRENCRGNFFAWFLYSVSLSFSLSLSLSRSLALFLSLSLINNYIHAYMCLTVSRQSRDHRPLSRDPSVSFYKKFPNCLKRPKTLFDSQPTVAWPPTTVAWPFSDFFQKNSNCLKRPKNVVWQSADGRVATDHCRVTLRWVFTKSFLTAWNVQKRCLTVSRRSRDLRPLSRDRSATFFKKISNCLKRPKNVVWQSADGRVTSDHCRVTVQRLLSKFSQIAWNVQKTSFDSRPMVAWPPTTVAWPFSDFFQNNFWLLETSKNRCLTVGRQSRDLRPLSRDRSATFFKKISICFKRRKNVVWQSADGRVTSDHCRVTVQWLLEKILIAWNIQKRCLTVARRSRDLNHRRVTVQRLFSKFSQIVWNVQKTLFDSQSTVAWPPTTVAWPFNDFFQIFF